LHLQEQLETEQFDYTQNLERVVAHVTGLEHELETVKAHVSELEEKLDEEHFDHKQNMDRVTAHVTELEHELKTVKAHTSELTEKLDKEQFDHKKNMDHAQAHVTELEQEVEALKQELDGISAVEETRVPELSEAQNKLASLQERSVQGGTMCDLPRATGSSRQVLRG